MYDRCMRGNGGTVVAKIESGRHTHRLQWIGGRNGGETLKTSRVSAFDYTTPNESSPRGVREGEVHYNTLRASHAFVRLRDGIVAMDRSESQDNGGLDLLRECWAGKAWTLSVAITLVE